MSAVQRSRRQESDWLFQQETFVSDCRKRLAAAEAKLQDMRSRQSRGLPIVGPLEVDPSDELSTYDGSAMR